MNLVRGSLFMRLLKYITFASFLVIPLSSCQKKAGEEGAADAVAITDIGAEEQSTLGENEGKTDSGITRLSLQDVISALQNSGEDTANLDTDGIFISVLPGDSAPGTCEDGGEATVVPLGDLEALGLDPNTLYSMTLCSSEVSGELGLAEDGNVNFSIYSPAAVPQIVLIRKYQEEKLIVEIDLNGNPEDTEFALVPLDESKLPNGVLDWTTVGIDESYGVEPTTAEGNLLVFDLPTKYAKVLNYRLKARNFDGVETALSSIREVLAQQVVEAIAAAQSEGQEEDAASESQQQEGGGDEVAEDDEEQREPALELTVSQKITNVSSEISTIVADRAETHEKVKGMQTVLRSKSTEIKSLGSDMKAIKSNVKEIRKVKPVDKQAIAALKEQRQGLKDARAKLAKERKEMAQEKRALVKEMKEKRKELRALQKELKKLKKEKRAQG